MLVSLWSDGQAAASEEMSEYIEDYLKPIICAARTYIKESSNKVLKNCK